MPKDWTIPEQTVVDKASGLTMRFWSDPNGHMRLSIIGNGEEVLKLGNRDLGFEKDIEGIAFSGTAIW